MRIMRFILCVTALLAVPCSLLAQAGASGTIVGTVTDSTGAIIPNARVTVTNTATGVASHTVTNSAGDFQAPSLRPGVYTAAAEEKGFSKSITSPFTLTVDQTVRLTIALKAGAVTETVQVSAQGVSLDTSDAALSQLVSQQQVAELPLDGRNFVQLLFLSAGAVTIGGEQGTMRQGEGNAISINGGRPEGNNFTLDGLTNNDTAMETPVVILSQDAIQEFKVESGVYPAEYGFSVGQVNIVSKGGTNSLHGAVFESNRSYNFDAQPFPTAGSYIAGQTIKNPVLELNQFGFVAGGPVEIPKLYHGRNKSFWMANYEGWRMNNGQVLSASFPYTPLISGGNFNNEIYPALPSQVVSGNTVALPGGALPAYGTPQCTALLGLGYNCMPIDPTTGNPFPSNTVPSGDFTARIYQMAIANTYFATPTIAGQTEGNTDFIKNVPGPLHQNQQTYRGDQSLGKLGQLMGRYTKTNYVNSTLYNSSSPTHGFQQYFEDGLSWEVMHTISLGQKNVNNFRLGYLSANAPQGSQAPTAAALATLGELNDFQTYSPLQQSWPGLSETDFSNGGGPGNSYTGSYSPQWDISDSFTSVRGKHTFGLGFEYRYWTILRNLDDDFYGDWGFSSNTITGNNLPIAAGLPNAGASSCPNAPESVNGAPAVPLCGTGNGVADLMLGYLSGVSGYVPGPLSPTTTAGNPQTHVYHYIGPYFEDNWKLTSKLSINYGLRYDFRAATYEVHNHFFWLDTQNANGGLCYADPTLTTDGVAPGGTPGDPILRYCGSVPRAAPKNPFAPRLAINYRLDNKTVLSAGYGIFYAGYEGREIDDSADIYPYSIRLALNPAGIGDPVADPKFSNSIWPAYGNLGPFPTASLSFIAVIESENPLNPYVETWTLGVQRELAKNTTLDINYIGNRGIHLLDRHMIAQPYDIPAADLPFCQEQDANGNYYNAVGSTAVAPCSILSRLPYPNFNGTYIDSDFHGYSMYNAGNIKLEHRAADLAATVVYTWAKSMDDKSATAGAGDSLTGYEGFMDNHNEHLDYGPSDFDVPQRFVASYVYQLPFGRGKRFASNINRAADLAIGQWQLTGIATFQKGFPYSVSANDIDGITGTGGMRAELVPGMQSEAK